MALARRTSPAWAIAASSLIIAAGQLLFLLTRLRLPIGDRRDDPHRTGRWSGVRDQPDPGRRWGSHQHRGSAISFHQLLQTVGYSLASALAATVLVAHTHPGQHLPTDGGYGSALLVALAILVATLLTSTLRGFRQPRRTGQPDLRGVPAAS